VEKHGVAVIISMNNKYLLLEDSRAPMKGKWGPPHGRCNKSDRTEEETVIREVFEETNFKVKPLKKLWTTKADAKTDTISFWLATIIDGQMRIDKRESSNHGWFTTKEALDLELYPATKNFFTLVKTEKIRI